jgi:hypothetical protein
MAGAAKEKVMSFPISLFVKSKAEDVPKGGLFFAKGNWWFRCDFDTPRGPHKSILSIAGPNIGGIGKADGSTGITLAPDHDWVFRVKEVADAAFSDSPKPGTIVVDEGGAPVIWGHIMDVPEHRHGFTIAGDQVPMYNEADGYPYLHYAGYQVWVIDPEGRVVGAGPIFETAAV